MMKELWKQVPLVIFTLLMPGIVLSYPFVVQGGFTSLGLLLALGGLSLGLASFHLRSPMAAPLVMEHFNRSWFSREAVFFALFFPGLLTQMLFPGLRVLAWTIPFLLVGLAGVYSTCFIYWQSPHLQKVRWLVEFIGEAFFVASLLMIISRGWTFSSQSWLYLGIMIALGIKILKDLLVSGVQLWQERENLLWVFTGTLALWAGGLLLSELWSQSGEFSWRLFFILGLSSVTLRLKLLSYVEMQTLLVKAEEARRGYMPAKYRKYF